MAEWEARAGVLLHRNQVGAAVGVLFFKAWGMAMGVIKREGGAVFGAEETSFASAPGGEFSLQVSDEYAGQTPSSISLPGGASFDLQRSRTRPKLAHVRESSEDFFIPHSATD